VLPPCALRKWNTNQQRSYQEKNLFPPLSKMHKQTLGGSIYSGLQKGLHVGQKALEYTALAKGIYETGQQLYTIGRTVAPMAAALL
jgi:hypothetical protein